jgi:hypothetical protein
MSYVTYSLQLDINIHASTSQEVYCKKELKIKEE